MALPIDTRRQTLSQRIAQLEADNASLRAAVDLLEERAGSVDRTMDSMLQMNCYLVAIPTIEGRLLQLEIRNAINAKR